MVTGIIKLATCLIIVVAMAASFPGMAIAQVSAPSTIPDFVKMPDDGYRPLTELIASASRTITVVTPSLTDPVILGALKSARARGVTIRVMTGSSSVIAGNSAEAQKIFAEAKILTLRPNSAFHETRESAIIVDGRTAAVSTSPLTEQAFAKGRAFVCVFLDPRYAEELTSAFDADAERKIFRPGFVYTAFSPESARGAAKNIISAAKNSLWIYAESIADEDIENALVKAAKSGVMVKVLTSDASAASMPGIVRLTQGGCLVRIQASPQITGSVILADTVTNVAAAFVGSQSLAIASFDENRELAVIVRDAHRISVLRSTFEKDWTAAQR